MEVLRDDIKWAVDYIRTTIDVDMPNIDHGLVHDCLYYGDFLATKLLNRHITWSSYMNVGGRPKCVALMMYKNLDVEEPNITPSRELLRACLEQAIFEIMDVMRSGGWDALKEFTATICNIVGQPKVIPEHMFYYATITLSKPERKVALKAFEDDKAQRGREYQVTFVEPEFDEEKTIYGNKYTSV